MPLVAYHGCLSGQMDSLATAGALGEPARMRNRSTVLVAALWLTGCGDSTAQPGGGPEGGAGTVSGGQAAAGGQTPGEGGASPVGGAAQKGGSSNVGGGTGGGAEGPEDPGSMTSDARIYTTDGTEYVIDAIGDAFAHAASGADDNLIFYVHGRGCGGGGEPQKSLGEAMPALEADYGSKAIMFNWQGSDVGCPLGFPEAEARASGAAFAHALHKLAFWKWQNANVLAGLKLTLITHSMGSLVLEEALANDALAFPPALFDTTIVGSAASAREGHAAWLTKASFSSALYVSVNGGDNVLTAAAALGGVRLGKSVDGEPLSANASYVDFTASDVNHAYYLHAGQSGSHMTAFYDVVMNGSAFDFATAAGIASVEMRDGTAIYHFDGQ